jgi:hypothetical protein
VLQNALSLGASWLTTLVVSVPTPLQLNNANFLAILHTIVNAHVVHSRLV